MKVTARCSLLALCVGVCVLHGGALTFDVASAKNRPVSKVITLLKDMLATLDSEAKEDQAIYNSMACWCETNDKEKTKAIADAEDRIRLLQTAIEMGTAKAAKLDAEIKQLEKEIAANKEALATATTLREKELSEFNAEEKELLETIRALDEAVTTLSKHHQSFLEIPAVHRLNMAARLQQLTEKHQIQLLGRLSRSEEKVLSSFIQQAPHLQEYAPQSGEIFGILKNMKETFEANLNDAQKDEARAQKAFEELRAAKEYEIDAGQKLALVKSEQLADTRDKLAVDKEDLRTTTDALSADEQFLLKLKEKCSLTDKEMEERMIHRQAEMSAVSKAIQILSTDDAKDLTSRTLGFLQVTDFGEAPRRSKAAKFLTAASQKTHNRQLAALAVQVRLDAFTKVKAAIDKMIAELQTQQSQEALHRNNCITSLNTNKKDEQKNKQKKSDLEAKIDRLNDHIKQLTANIEQLGVEIFEVNVNLKRAGEDRERASKLFQTTIADQRETQALLTKALGVLQGFYAESLLQAPVGPPPPPGFKELKKNAASGGVIKMIQMIINDAKAMEDESLKDESDSHAEYVAFVAESGASLKAKLRSETDQKEDRAKAEGDLAKASTNLDGTNTQLELVASEFKDLTESCDYVTKNFDVRQKARSEEISALRTAKAILSGAGAEIENAL